MKHNVQAVAAQFVLYGDFVSARPYGSGHINDTYAVTMDQSGVPVRYIFQRINHQVFKDPVGLMENVERVTRHIHHKLEEMNAPQASRRALSVVPTRDGRSVYRDPAGNYWRVYLFVENAATYDVIETPEQAYQAARAFGEFQKYLVDLPGGRLNETIPDFHNTPKRYHAFAEALARDVAGRAADAQAEIAFVQAREAMTHVLVDLHRQKKIPERVTHNDTKLNNVMLDNETNKGICVIDLDTVMPGLVLYDFGDLVRTSTSPAAEDERDLSKVEMQMPMFEALARGYVESAGDFLTQAELDYLAFSGKLITFEIGLRFLTDYLQGDVYFKVHREGHNLDRCRTQFRLVQCIEEQEEAMNALVRSLVPAAS